MQAIAEKPSQTPAGESRRALARYRFGDHTLDLGRFELRKGADLVHVEPQVFEVLSHLVRHRDRVVSKEELLDEIWGTRFVTESTLTTRIKAARRAIGDRGDSQHLIRTVRGRGFRFVADVEPHDGAAASGDRAQTPAGLPAPTPGRGRLPHAATALVGRDHELAAVGEALHQSRLITVVGTGGVGKTRLAMEVSRLTRDRFPDGAYWCDWASVTEASAAVDALADSLDVGQQSGLSTMRSIVNAVGERCILVVADNCEHIVDGAAVLIEELLTNCPRLRVLATSRAPLGTTSERLCPVSPLSTSAAGPEIDLPPGDAARLFAERAMCADPAFALTPDNLGIVESICARVGGLPLGIEIAAARLRTFTVGEVAHQLDEHHEILATSQRGRVARHGTLRATMDWSYQLVGSDERRLFDRLGVFAGGFTLEDARALVRELGEPEADVRRHLEALADQSMVTADRSGRETRYLMLEPLRAYALQRLGSGPAMEATRDAHTAWAVGLGESLAEPLRGPDEGDAVRRMDAEFANLRSAHLHSVRSGDVDAALRLVAGLHLYSMHRLRDEVFTWVETAAGLDGADEHPLFPVVVGSLAQGLANRGELGRARSLAEQTLDVCQEGDVRSMWAIRTLCNVAVYEGRLQDAVSLANQGLEIARRRGDHVHAAYSLVTHVLAHTYSGDRDAAMAAVREQRYHAETSANPTQLAWARYCHGEALRTTDPRAALDLFTEAIAVGEQVDSHFVVGVALVSLASTRSRLGDAVEALRAFDRIVDHWHRRGDWAHQWTTLRNVVPILHRLGHDADTAMLLGAATGPHADAPSYGETRRELDRIAASVADRLGPHRMRRQLERGRTLSPDETVRITRRAIAAALDTAV